MVLKQDLARLNGYRSPNTFSLRITFTLMCWRPVVDNAPVCRPAGAVRGHVPRRAGVLLADQRPPDRRHVHVAAEHRVVLRHDHGEDSGARPTQPGDGETVFDGRDERVPFAIRDRGNDDGGRTTRDTRR